MNIAVSTRLLQEGSLEGIGWFSHEVLSRWVKNDKENKFYFLFDRKHSKTFDYAGNVEAVELFPPARHPILWYIFLEISIKRFVAKRDIDLFVSLDGWMPRDLKNKSGKRVPIINTIHDINFEHFPSFLRYSHRKYCRHFFPIFAKKADRIITVSNFSKRDIANTYKVDREKIDVIYNAPRDIYKPESEDKKLEIRQKYSQGCKYFIYIGSINKRKNVARAIRAFDVFRRQTKENFKFLICGAQMGENKDVFEAYREIEHKEDVLFMGRMSSQDLSEVLSAATALILPSIFEGFGMPIVEAFAAQVPVICSKLSAMPEIAGDAALYIDPYSVGEIADAFTQIATSDDLAKTLIERSKLRLEEFSWDRSANKLQEIAKNLVNCSLD